MSRCLSTAAGVRLATTLRSGDDQHVLTASARTALTAAPDRVDLVLSRAELRRRGIDRHRISTHVAAGRWQRIGRAILLHNGAPSRAEAWRAALINCSPRAVLTSFTAAEAHGLTGWTREEIHVRAPAGTQAPRLPDMHVIVHRAAHLDPVDHLVHRRLHRLAPALVLAAGSFRTPRSACGLFAAAVQQRLVTADELRRAALASSRIRHRGELLSAADDIAMGADALSEIDFVRLCRRHRLPMPSQQAVRVESSGRRRYLDAEWLLSDGRQVVVEVDGAIHLTPRRWFDDQLRQNELVLSGAAVLRFPSVVVRTEPALVADQIRRALSRSTYTPCARHALR